MELISPQGSCNSEAEKKMSYKQKYYQEKFGISASDFPEFIHTMKAYYIEALHWNIGYYYQGCISWSWFYPYHYAPFASDLTDVDQIFV